MSHNTCEFIAQTEKLVSLLHATTFKNNKPYKPANMNVVIEIWQESLASESFDQIFSLDVILGGLFGLTRGLALSCLKKITQMMI